MAKYIDQSPPCKLTESEVHGKIRKVLTYKKELRSILAEEAAFKFKIKTRKEEVEPTIDALEKEIAEETEMRWVKCELVFDTEAMTVSTMRLDTYELVGKSRAMTQEEIDRYVKIDLVREAERADRAKAAQAKATPNGAANDPLTPDQAPGAPAGEIAADGSEPADSAPEDLPGNSDPDGWLAQGDAAQAAACAQEAPTASLEADSTFPAVAGDVAPETLAEGAPDGRRAPEEPQGDLLAAGETWAVVDGEKAPEATAEDKAGT